jgi:AraC-like DNA-binding protein
VAAGTGLPVAGFLRRIKLNQVSERLIQTSASASTISAALGFSSDSSMRRMFKELTGLTPAEYRQAFGRS